jgi:hypothetical protein
LRIANVIAEWAMFRTNPQSAIRNPYYAGASAMTRTGLPLPRTIFNGAAMTTAPVAGS